MALTITNDCNSCGLCEVECPTEAIVNKKGVFSIDVEECTECEACVKVCFPNSITNEEQINNAPRPANAN